MIHAIILSKDRACQLHLLLESLKKNSYDLFEQISVVYTYSTDEFAKGYERVRREFPDVKWELEDPNFQMSLLRVGGLASQELTCFFTDDDIFYRDALNKCDAKLAFRFHDADIFSLRLGQNTIIQDPYAGSKVVLPQPKMVAYQMCSWDWSTVPHYTNFGYPLSVDGHIFKTKEIMDLLASIKFHNPNSMEAALHSQRDRYGKIMVCCKNSFVFNTPLNRVQETCQNKAGVHFGKSAEMLNEKYIQGYRLNLDSIDADSIVGCHQEVDLEFIK
jgi:hypothetical protein